MKQKRVLHSAGLLSISPGILHQLKNERHSVTNLDIPWTVSVFSLDHSDEGFVQTLKVRDIFFYRLPVIGRLLKRRIFFKNYFDWLESVAPQYDLLVLRYLPHSLHLLRFLKHTCKPVFLVHHTLEGPEIKAGGSILNFIRSMADDYIFRRLAPLVSGAIGVTEEIVEYEKRRGYNLTIPTHVYPNGIIVDKKNLSPPASSAERAPGILFTASRFTKRQGLESLLLSCSKSPHSFKLHIVGDVTAQQKAIAAEDPRIVFHGTCSVEKIAQIANECDVGLGAFRHHALGMTQACTLKVREYLSLGLPVYAGHFDILPKDFPFFRKGPCDLESILEFAFDIKRYSKEAIIEEATPHIDKQRLLRNLYHWLCKTTS